MSFEEPDRIHSRLWGDGWRRLSQPVPVRCYVAGRWMDQPAGEVNDETREIRVAVETADHGLVHVILDAAGYMPSPLLFRGHGEATVVPGEPPPGPAALATAEAQRSPAASVAA